MSYADQLAEIVIRQATQTVLDQGADAPAAVTRDTSLFGPTGLLDSVGLVSLVLAVEQEISDLLGVSVSLADEKALSQRHSPFRTIGTLVDYAAREIEAKRAAS
jgi:D-alanine--poly(phosphoribitol) ligase subunit 2